MKNQKINYSEILFTNTAVAITKGGRFMAQAFKFPDGEDGSIVIIKKTGRRNWQPNIKSIIIEYNEDNTSTD